MTNLPSHLTWNKPDNKEWVPTVYIAKCCDTEIFSKRPGQFASCQCGNSFVDETRDYCRMGGDVVAKYEGSK